MNYFKKRKIQKHLDWGLRKNDYHPSGEYENYRKGEIECLEWLRSYYEGNCCSNPKEILEIDLKNWEWIKQDPIRAIAEIKVLYFWIKYGKIEAGSPLLSDEEFINKQRKTKLNKILKDNWFKKLYKLV